MTSKEAPWPEVRDAVEEYLTGRGIEVLDRDWRGDGGEIHILAVEGRELVICEVKSGSRARSGQPLETISQTRKDQLRRLAVQWLNAHGKRFERIRVDVIGLLRQGVGEFTVEHIRAVG